MDSRNFIKLFGFLFVLSVLSTPFVSASSGTITAESSDAYIEYHDGAYYADFPTGYLLRAGTVAGGIDYWYRSYLEFDTSTIPDGMYQAKLYVYYYSKADNDAIDCNVILESIPNWSPIDSSDWNISGNTTIDDEFVNIDDAFGWYSIDITDYIGATTTNFRLRGDAETTGSEQCRFGFRSTENVTYAPYIEYYASETNMPNFNVSYSSSRQIYAESSCGFLLPSTEPYDPKIACETDGDSCVAIFYDHQSLCSQGLKYSVSFDGFESSCPSAQCYHGLITSTSFGQTTYLNPMIERGGELPYDIAWDDNTNMYYIVIGAKVYVIPAYDPQVAGVTPYRVTDGFALATGGTAGADLTPDCCTETGYKSGQGYSCATNSIHGIKFANDDATKLFGTYQAQPFKGGLPYDWDGYFAYFTYDVTNTTTTGNGNLYDCSELYTTPSCSAGSNFGTDYYSAYAEYSDSGSWKYNIEAQLDYCTGTTDVVHDFDNFASPNDDFNHFYFGGNLYWRNETISTMYSSESSDLSAFSSPELQYSELVGINEAINQSDADSGGNSNFYIWYRSSSLTDGSDGIWLQEQTTYPVIVNSNKDVFVTLSCDVESYTTTGSGKIMQLYTPCQTGNSITFISSYSPQSDSRTFSFGSCDTVSFGLHYPDNPYDFTFTVKDAISNEVLSGVEISMTGESDETSDSNGQAVFNINAITSPSFKSSASDCSYQLSTSGTPKTFYVSAEKDGYVDTDYQTTPADLTEADINSWSFDDNDLITMYPNGVVVDVHIFTSDGEEITVDSYNASVTGNNGLTYTFIKNKATLRNWNRNIPSTFLLYDNRTTYNITIDIEYPGGSDSQTKSVTENNQYDVYFYLPYTFLDLPCSDISDCVGDFCDLSGFHHKLSGCVDQNCEYSTTDCQTPDLCDDEDGCYSVGTEISCTKDSQCLYNTNVTECIDDYSMYVGFCGSDGFCKQKEQSCTTFCNETVGYCNEKAQCIVPDITDIGFEWEGGKSLTHYTCTFDNAGTSYCIQHGEITYAELQSLGKTISDVYFTHDGFKITDTGTSYKIGDVVVSCSDTCDVGISFCNSGECSADTNQCLNNAAPNDFGSMIWNGWLWVSSFVPVELRMLAWLIFTVIVMIYYKQETGEHGKSNDQSTLIVGFFIFVAGFTIGWIHWIFLLILGVGIALIISQKIGQ